MGQASDCSTLAPEGRGRDSLDNCSKSVEKRPIGLSPKTWSLNPIPDGDGGDSNVDQKNDNKEDGDDDFFFYSISWSDRSAF